MKGDSSRSFSPLNENLKKSPKKKKSMIDEEISHDVLVIKADESDEAIFEALEEKETKTKKSTSKFA